MQGGVAALGDVNPQGRMFAGRCPQAPAKTGLVYNGWGLFLILSM